MLVCVIDRVKNACKSFNTYLDKHTGACLLFGILECHREGC